MPNQFFSPEGDLEGYFVDEYWLIDQWVGDTLWTCGYNLAGQLGINVGGTTTGRTTPVTTLAGGTNWKQVAVGDVFVSSIKSDGTLWIWGRNTWGQLGINAADSRSTPVTTFAGGTNWKQVDCGGNHSAAVKTDGTLWVWGQNYYGQLGINVAGITTGRTTPVTTFAGGTNWKQVSCGPEVIAAIKTDGTLWTWGRNISGILGVNDTNGRTTPVTTFAGGNNWKQVTLGSTSGSNHIAAVKTDGTLWVWGQNGFGQLGNNASGDRLTPVTTFAGGTNWKQVTCVSGNTAAIKTDGTLWVWGQNDFGQLGINVAGATTGRTTPVTTFAGGTNWKQVDGSAGQSIGAIKTDGTLWFWGRNEYGQFGVNDTNVRSTPTTALAGGTNWKQVSCGRTTAALTSGTNPIDFIS
jgi:alpha-tubulin suppressor-like RCC1 family protein